MRIVVVPVAKPSKSKEESVQKKMHSKSLFFAVPSSPPEGITCQGVTPAGIELKWDLLTAEKLRGKLTSYKIHYQEVTSLDLKDSKSLS